MDTTWLVGDTAQTVVGVLIAALGASGAAAAGGRALQRLVKRTEEQSRQQLLQTYAVLGGSAPAVREAASLPRQAEGPPDTFFSPQDEHPAPTAVAPSDASAPLAEWPIAAAFGSPPPPPPPAPPPPAGVTARQLEEQSLDVRQSALHLEYHAQGLAQSKISFGASMLAAALGFLVLVAGVALALLGRTDTAIVTVASSVVTEAVAALFFHQANKARDLMRQLFDTLREDRRSERQLETSLELIEQISDVTTRDRLRAAVSLRLVDPQATTASTAEGLNGGVPHT